MLSSSRLKLLRKLLTGVLGLGSLGTPIFVPDARAQGGSIYRQVVSPDIPTGTGQPAPGAAVRVCTSTATGTPCSPLAPNVYSDPTLTTSIANPFSADSNGNYSVFLPTGVYIVQETPVPGTVYSFLIFVNGTGTVSSVGLNLPGSVFQISGSPVNTTGTLTGTFIAQSANTVFANCTGSTAVPVFCGLTANMIPATLNATTINGLTVNGSSTLNGNTAVTGTLSSSALATLASLTVSGGTTLSGGGALSGTFTGTPTFTDNLVFSGDVSFTGNPAFTVGVPSFANGASLVGTFTGNPTLSGNPTFSGTPVLSNGASLVGNFTGSPTFPGNPAFSGNPVFGGDPSFTANPNFSGDPQAVTQAISDNDNSLATTAFVQNVIGAANGFAISKTTNGYIKLPDTLGGLVLQWMTGPSNPPTGETNFTVTFPLAFPHACLNVQVSPLIPSVVGNSGDMSYQVISFNSTSAHIYLQEFSDGRDVASQVLVYAIGY